MGKVIVCRGKAGVGKSLFHLEYKGMESKMNTYNDTISFWNNIFIKQITNN